MKDVHHCGATLRRVDMLRPGDRVDLQYDPVANPNGSRFEFQFEFSEVLCVERETADCIRVDFDNASCGFPSGHLVDVDGEQVLPDLESRTPLADEIGAIYER